jgi:hypothetical protein
MPSFSSARIIAYSSGLVASPSIDRGKTPLSAKEFQQRAQIF